MVSTHDVTLMSRVGNALRTEESSHQDHADIQAANTILARTAGTRLVVQAWRTDYRGPANGSPPQVELIASWTPPASSAAWTASPASEAQRATCRLSDELLNYRRFDSLLEPDAITVPSSGFDHSSISY